jgi:NADH:ubiquinone oxidoreductase subunit 6 (subunit J)
VGRELFGTFLLPFEVASLLLVVGIVAAVVLGSSPSSYERRGRER